MSALTDDTLPATPRAIRDEMIVFAHDGGAAGGRAADRHLSVLRHAGAVLCAAGLRLQPADRLWRPAVVRPCDVPGHRRLLHRACAEGLGLVARTRDPGRHRRRRRARRHHRRRRHPPPGHLLLDDHAGAVAAVVFHLSADAVHPWRRRHPGHSAGLPVRNFQSRQADRALLRHPGRVPRRLSADLSHHQLAVRRGAEGDPRERAARDLARLQDRSVQAARLYPVRDAGGICRLAEGVRGAECLADRRALDACRAKSC